MLLLLEAQIKYLNKSQQPHFAQNKYTNEPRHQIFTYAKTKTQISCAVTVQISAFVFATRIIQSLLFLNPKFQASSHVL